MSCAKYLGVARPAGLPSGESESPTIDDSLRATSFVSHSSSFSGNSRTQSTAGGHSVSSTIRDIAKPAKPARRSEVTARVKELCKSHGSSVLQRRHCISCGELPERRLGNANCEHRAVSTRPDSQVRRIQDGMEANSEAVDSHCDYANPWVYDGGKPLVDDFTGALSKDENKEIKRKAGRSKTELHLPLRGQSRTTSPANQRPEQWTPRKKIITSTTSAYPLSHSRGKHAQSMPSSSTCREGNSNSNTSSMFRFRPGNEHSDYVEPMDSLGPLPPKGLTWRADLPQSGAMPRSQARHSPVLNKGRSSSSAQLTGMSSALPSSAAPGMSAHKSVQKKKTLTSSISLGRSPVHPLPSLSEDEPRSAMRPRSVARNSSSISSAAQRARDQVMRQSQSSASDVPTGELGDDDIFFAQMFHSSTLDGCCAHPVSLEIQVITDGHAKVVSGAPDTPGLRRHIAMASKLEDLLELMTSSGWSLSKFTQPPPTRDNQNKPLLKKALAESPQVSHCVFTRCSCAEQQRQAAKSISSGHGSLEELQLDSHDDITDSSCTSATGSLSSPDTDGSRDIALADPAAVESLGEYLNKKETAELLLLLRFFGIRLPHLKDLQVKEESPVSPKP